MQYGPLKDGAAQRVRVGCRLCHMLLTPCREERLHSWVSNKELLTTQMSERGQTICGDGVKSM